MKRLNKIALSVMVVVAVGIGFSGCDIADESKAPLIEMEYNDSDNNDLERIINLTSQDDETIIKNMSIIGRNGKCDVKDLGAGGKFTMVQFGTPLWSISLLKYGEQLVYDKKRSVLFTSKNCPPKNGKYEIELNTNFGTYRYEMATTR